MIELFNFDWIIRKIFVLREGKSQAALHGFEYQVGADYNISKFDNVKHYSPKFVEQVRDSRVKELLKWFKWEYGKDLSRERVQEFSQQKLAVT